jgi:hypothetical protein
MSKFLTEEKRQNFLTFGWCVIKTIIPQPNEIADSTIKETIQTVLQ